MGKASRVKRELKISESQRQNLVDKGVKHIQNASTAEQIDFLYKAVRTGGTTHNTIRRQIEQNAPAEMWKGVLKFAREGKPLTVDALLSEYRADKGFQKLALNAGLDEQWFIALAESKLEAFKEQQKEQKQEQPEEKQWQLQPVTMQAPEANPESAVHRLLRKLRLTT